MRVVEADDGAVLRVDGEADGSHVFEVRTRQSVSERKSPVTEESLASSEFGRRGARTASERGPSLLSLTAQLPVTAAATMSHDPSDRFLVLSFPSISHWVTLPRATSSSSPLSSHLDAVHHAAQQTTQSLTVVIRTPSDAPSPWRNPSAPTTSSPPLSSSPSSDPSLSPTALFLPLEQALARVYNAATSAFFASDDGPLKNVDVVVEQLRDISRVCIPQDAQVDRWEWTDAAAEGDGKGKGKADGARAPPPPPEAGASSGLPPLYPVVALGGTFDHLHAGHKILLTMACSLCSQRLVVGVSGPSPPFLSLHQPRHSPPPPPRTRRPPPRQQKVPTPRPVPRRAPRGRHALRRARQARHRVRCRPPPGPSVSG